MSSSESESFHCLLCRGVVSHSDLNLRYKDHLKREHKVYFYTNWIIDKTTQEEQNIVVNEELENDNVPKVKNVEINHSQPRKGTSLKSSTQPKNVVLFQPFEQPKMERIESSSYSKNYGLFAVPSLPKKEVLQPIVHIKTEKLVESPTQNKTQMFQKEKLNRNLLLNSSITCQPVSLTFDFKNKNNSKSENNSEKVSDYEKRTAQNSMNKVNNYASTNFNFDDVPLNMKTSMAITDEEQGNITGENVITSEHNLDNGSNNRHNDEVRELDHFISTITNDTSTDFNFVKSSFSLEAAMDADENNEEQLLEESINEQESNDDQSLNDEYFNDSTSEVLKPSLLISTTSDGSKVFSCSYCPEKIFSSKSKGKRHVIRAKSHELIKRATNIYNLNYDQNNQTEEGGICAEDSNNDSKILKLSLLVKRDAGGRRMFICSFCPGRIFSTKSMGMRHIAKVKSHDLTQSVVDQIKEDSTNLNLNDDESGETMESSQDMKGEQSSGPISERKPRLLIKRKSDGGKMYGCSFCPGKCYPNKWKAKKHVTKAKFHDENPSADPNKPSVLITRGSDGKRVIGCSVCPRVFKDRKKANIHVTSSSHKSVKYQNLFVGTATDSSGENVYSCSICPQYQNKKSRWLRDTWRGTSQRRKEGSTSVRNVQRDLFTDSPLKIMEVYVRHLIQLCLWLI